ncbi:MAG: hypothetical protein LBS89_06340 [Zoogloeaceae bacterium]|jgi:hypothetical protein|nr:hypothetical protein [Zoogloeaceae bacterium]
MPRLPKRINTLIDALAQCLPQFDAAPLRANPPENTKDTEEVTEWLFDHLVEQGLLWHLEWMRYGGDKPDLKPLADVDFSEFDTFWTSAEELARQKAIMPWDLLFLEVMNSLLPSGLQLVDLVEDGNGDESSVLCVTTNAALLEPLEKCLASLNLEMSLHEPLHREEALQTIEMEEEEVSPISDTSLPKAILPNDLLEKIATTATVSLLEAYGEDAILDGNPLRIIALSESFDGSETSFVKILKANLPGIKTGSLLTLNKTSYDVVEIQDSSLGFARLILQPHV